METGPPHFVGIGAQKSGTTRWFMLMRQHPRLFVPDFAGHPFPAWYRKERHFFDPFFEHDFTEVHARQYHQWFPRPAGTITGEWTPRYCVDPWVAPLLAQAAPDTRILLFLRDPVRRFTSGMAHAQRHDALVGGVAIEHYARGLYAQQLEHWLQFFSRDQILVLQFEQTLQEPAAHLATTFRFVGLPPYTLPDALFEREVNARRTTTDYALPGHLRKTLVTRYTGDVLRLRELVPDLDLNLWPHFAHLA